MKKRKVMALLLTAAMVIGSLAGCGEKPTDTPSDNDQQKEEQPEDNQEEEPGDDANAGDDASAGGGDKTITVSVQTKEGAQAGWEAVAKAYMDKHPDVNVVIDLKAGEGYSEWLNNVFSTNETTNVDIVNINLAAEAATNKDIDFSDYLENDSPYSDGVWQDQFEIGKQVRSAATGKMNALSLDSVQVLWLYNQNIFDEVGIEAVPTTWDELIAACDKIQAAGYQPIAMPGDYDSFYSGTMGWLAQIYADQTTRSTVDFWRSQEGDYCYDPDIDGAFTYDPTDPFNDDNENVTRNPVRFFAAVHDGTYTVKTPGMKTVWSNFANVFPKYAGDEAMFGTNGNGAKTLFYQGKAAMYVDGGWGITGFIKDMKALESGGEVKDADGNVIEGVAGFELGTFNMPSMEGEGIEAPARTIEVATGFLGCVSKSQEHNDLVVDFLMYYSSQEGMSTFMQAAMDNGFTVDGPSLVYGVEYPDDVMNAFENLTMIGNCQKSYGQSLARGFCEIPESYRSFYQYCYDYLTGSINVDEFLDQHQKNMDDNFETGMKNNEIGYSDLENPANEPTGE